MSVSCCMSEYHCLQTVDICKDYNWADSQRDQLGQALSKYCLL